MEKTIRLTTAQALLKFLNQQYISIDGKETPYVEGIFHVYGHGNVLGIGQALEQAPGHLKSYSGKNEQGMAHLAIAFARQSLRKKIFAVSASAGPGSANLLTALLERLSLIIYLYCFCQQIRLLLGNQILYYSSWNMNQV